ncbi:unnamed protein product [Paramecium sonneborni]|uniref:Uncharacterized protein n=1 Tax=Paramecium sonneborni TaxID=65129 RepID=A0A8S1RN47_9CILI|nr:unnamed protein product [Paramecium sonneborni]
MNCVKRLLLIKIVQQWLMEFQLLIEHADSLQKNGNQLEQFLQLANQNFLTQKLQGHTELKTNFQIPLDEDLIVSDNNGNRIKICQLKKLLRSKTQNFNGKHSLRRELKNQNRISNYCYDRDSFILIIERINMKTLGFSNKKQMQISLRIQELILLKKIYLYFNQITIILLIYINQNQRDNTKFEQFRRGSCRQNQRTSMFSKKQEIIFLQLDLRSM